MTEASETSPQQHPVQTQQTGERQTAEALAVSAHYEGPIPPPGMLRAYDEIVQGSASRILQMAEDEVSHRRRMELEVLDIEKKRMELTFNSHAQGRILGFIIAGTCTIAATYGLVAGANPWLVAAFISLPVASIIKAVVGEPRDRKDQEKKDMGEAK